MKEMVEQTLLPQIVYEQVNVELNKQEQYGRWKVYVEYKDSGVEWLEKIPDPWSVRRFKYLARLKYGNALPSERREEGNVPVFGSNGPVGTHSQANTFNPVIIIGRKGSFGKIAYLEEPCFAIDTTYYIDIVQNEVNIRWLFYALKLLKLDVFTEDSAIPGLSREYVYSRWLPFPPHLEQSRISSFLDHETVRINNLIAKKEQHIALLQEQRTAIINQAVTKGLNTDVSMKDSGVEWLGEIPEHWEAIKIKRLCIVKRGASPRPIDDQKYFDDNGEYAWVRISDVTASNRYLRDTEQRLSPLGANKSVKLQPGELFLSIAGSVGKAIITEIKCCIHDGFVYFVGLKECREYLYYIFSCGELYKGLGKLGTQLNLNTDTIGDIYIPVPSLEEQQTIVAYLEQETTKIDKLITRIQESVKKLKEYSTALVSAAVTGQIDVRGEVVAGSAEDVTI